MVQLRQFDDAAFHKNLMEMRNISDSKLCRNFGSSDIQGKHRLQLPVVNLPLILSRCEMARKGLCHLTSVTPR
jgi:hypothetical protein